jgi:hypothetical protein
MARARQHIGKVIVPFVVFVAAYSAQGFAGMNVLDVRHGPPPDPRPGIKKAHSKQPYRKLEDVYEPLNQAITKLAHELSEEDYEAAEEQIQVLEQFAGKVPTGGLPYQVTGYLIGVFDAQEKYETVLWLAENSSAAFARDPMLAGHPGAFTCYYSALWKTRGRKAVKQAYDRHVEITQNQGRREGLLAGLRLGWIETQLAEGELETGAVKRQLTEQALADEAGLSLRWNYAYRILTALCMNRGKYDWLRRVALRGVFETGEKTELRRIWKSTLLPLWRLDDEGPDYLIEMTDEYLADCEDSRARARARFFQASMHRLAAAMLYRQVMEDKEADKMFAADSDLRFLLKESMVRPDQGPLDVIVLSGNKAPANSLSQQAARYLKRLAPDSTVREWPMGPASEELKKRLRQRMLRKHREKRRKKKGPEQTPPQKGQ